MRWNLWQLYLNLTVILWFKGMCTLFVCIYDGIGGGEVAEVWVCDG